MESRASFINAEAYFDAGLFEKAIEMYDQAFSLDNHLNVQIRCKRGLAYSALNQVDNAILEYENANESSHGHSFLAAIKIGEFYENKADSCSSNEEKQAYYSKAAFAYRSCLDKIFYADERFNQLYSQLKKLKMNPDKLCNPYELEDEIDPNSEILDEQPIKQLNVKINKENTKYNSYDYVNNGDVYYFQGNFDAAIKMYNHAIELESHLKAYYHRGKAYFKLREFKKAISDFTTVIQNDSTNPNVYLNRALSYDQYFKIHKHNVFYRVKVDYSPMINDLITASKLEPTLLQGQSYLNLLLADFSKNRSNYNKLSDESLEQLINIQTNEQNYLFYLSRGKDYHIHREFHKAIAVYNKLIEVYPHRRDITNVYYSRGRAYLALRDFRHAINDFNKTIEFKPDDMLAYAYRANAYSELNDYRKAVDDYTKLITLDPTNDNIYFHRALAYKDMNNFEHALADFTKAIKLNPKIIERIKYQKDYILRSIKKLPNEQKHTLLLNYLTYDNDNNKNILAKIAYEPRGKITVFGCHATRGTLKEAKQALDELEKQHPELHQKSP